MSARSTRRLPDHALVVACVALAVSLSGTAVAAGIVANARHANRADLATRALNSDRVQGRTAVQIATAGAQAGAQLPGPASTAAALVSVKIQAAAPVPPRATVTYTISCDAGARILAGGYASPGPVHAYDSHPTGEGTWTFELANDDTAPAELTLYATCLK
jgi:hypothetical protein